ncbi:hypothetical protein M514_00677 [Trichuris suis]|uniref:Uncharacterized protein n=1 Tax=Trichuris suis TaxID=68888 RepID=A0A085MV41_9BILA|nr:hypothetical protein M514_00677 [Trichuris suis]
MQLCSRGPTVCPQWRCRNSPCRRRVSARQATWFAGSRRRLSLEKAIGVIVAWSIQLSSLKFCKTQLGLNESTTVRWNRHLRSVAAQAVGEVSHPIGGPSKTVELYEILLCRRKYNRGRPYGRRQWVFGGRCRETGAPTFVRNNRTGRDCFVAKRAHRQRCGTHRSALPLHLCELMWRRRLTPGEDEFDRIVHDIATLHPPV